METIANVIEVAARCCMGMEIKSNLKKLVSKPMNRQDFIRRIAIGAVAVMGGGTVVRMGMMAYESDQIGSQHAGHGDSAYGGAKQGGEEPARRAA